VVIGRWAGSPVQIILIWALPLEVREPDWRRGDRGSAPCGSAAVGESRSCGLLGSRLDREQSRGFHDEGAGVGWDDPDRTDRVMCHGARHGLISWRLCRSRGSASRLFDLGIQLVSVSIGTGSPGLTAPPGPHEDTWGSRPPWGRRCQETDNAPNTAAAASAVRPALLHRIVYSTITAALRRHH